jgi:glycosyltransferase involved in cell wall biosynthesis
VKVSVIVPAFNAEATLEAAVHSLLATGYHDLEVLVVDDGSSDSTLEIARRLTSSNTGVVRVVSHAGCAHRGVSASRNLGIDASRGELIAFLDADDVVLPNRFKISVAMLQEQPSTDGIYELTQIANRCKQPEESTSQWRDGCIFGIDESLYGAELMRKLMTGIPWGTCAFLCRRSLFDRIGPFDEGRSLAEDCHFWIRAAAAATILPANPLTVVSLYVRDGNNTYDYSLLRRLDLLDAMADAGQWIRKYEPLQWPLWQAGFTSYLERCMIAAREADSLTMLAKQLQLCLRYRLYRPLLQWQVVRQILAEAKHRVDLRRVYSG